MADPGLRREPCGLLQPGKARPCGEPGHFHVLDAEGGRAALCRVHGVWAMGHARYRLLHAWTGHCADGTCDVSTA